MQKGELPAESYSHRKPGLMLVNVTASPAHPVDRQSILWQFMAVAANLKTVHITLTPQIAELLKAEVAAGRFANLSEAVRNAVWKAFAEDPAAELRAAFSQLDESPDDAAPSGAKIASEIGAWRAPR